MSRRTAPVFDGARQWNSLSSAHRHSQGHSTLPIHLSTPSSPKSPPGSVSQQLFDDLDNARFAQVRRAVAADPVALLATASPRTALFSAASQPAPQLTPVDYALHNCRIWQALIEHCERTGITIPHHGDFTFRNRLIAMDAIVSWLLLHPFTPEPSRAPLHTALTCRLESSFDKLLQMYPNLASSVDARGKTPLHVCCALLHTLSPLDSARYVRMLADAGADMNARDAEGRTALHDLVSALSFSTPSYGLVRRRRQARSLLSMLPTVNELLLNGANIHAADSRTDTPMDVAMANGVDYVVFTLQTNWVYEQICYTRLADGYRQGEEAWANGGALWGKLPEDVIVRILRMLSPRDVVTGVGATCHALRRIALSRHLWIQYTTDYAMTAMRESLWRRGMQHPSVRGTDGGTDGT